jgi:MFS family permease
MPPVNGKRLWRPTKEQRKRTIKLAISSTIISTIAGTCIGNNIITLLAVDLGAGPVFVGFLTFAGAFPVVFRAFTMSTMERVGKKRLLVYWTTIGTIFILPMLAVPPLAQRSADYFRLCLWIIMFSSAVRYTLFALGDTGWFPILQDSVPRSITGRFFASMRVAWQTALLIATLAVAWLLKGEGHAFWKFEVLFAAALLLHVIKVFTFIPMVERPPHPPREGSPSIVERMLEALREAPMRAYLMYLVTYTFAMSVTGQFRLMMLKEEAHYSNAFIIFTTSLAPVGAILTLRLWGRIADRFGNRAILNITHLGMILSCCAWVFVHNSVTGMLLTTFLYFIMSVFGSGTGIVQTRYMMHIVPVEKQYYITICNVASGVVSGLAPLIGGFFLDWTSGIRFETRYVDFNNYNILFVLSAILFVLPHIQRKTLSIAHETSTIEVIAFVTRPLLTMFGPFASITRPRTPHNRPKQTELP